jgi:hypothetical protein
MLQRKCHINEMLRTRMTLIGRLANRDDAHAWKEFVDIYLPVVYGFGQLRDHGDYRSRRYGDRFQSTGSSTRSLRHVHGAVALSFFDSDRCHSPSMRRPTSTRLSPGFPPAKPQRNVTQKPTLKRYCLVLTDDSHVRPESVVPGHPSFLTVFRHDRHPRFVRCLPGVQPVPFFVHPVVA